MAKRASQGTPVGRRVVLGMLGAGAAGVLFGSKAADLLEKITAPLTLRDGSGLLALFPVGRFRYYSVTGPVTSKTATDYRLSVRGAVGTPLSLSVDDLRAMTPTLLTHDFQCVTGWRVHDVKWAGVKLGDLLDRAGVDLGGGWVRFVSFDGVYTESLSMAQARRDDILVAYEMEGKPVTHDHGGPVRLYCASMYGYKSCKWLETVEVVTTDPGPGYWEERGYDIDGWLINVPPAERRQNQ